MNSFNYVYNDTICVNMMPYIPNGIENDYYKMMHFCLDEALFNSSIDFELSNDPWRRVLSPLAVNKMNTYNNTYNYGMKCDFNYIFNACANTKKTLIRKHYSLHQNVLHNNNNITGSALKSNINITNIINSNKNINKNSNKKNKNSIKKIASIKNNNIVNCVK